MRFIEKSKQKTVLKLANETFIKVKIKYYYVKILFTFCDFNFFLKKYFQKKIVSL